MDSTAKIDALKDQVTVWNYIQNSQKEQRPSNTFNTSNLVNYLGWRSQSESLQSYANMQDQNQFPVCNTNERKQASFMQSARDSSSESTGNAKKTEVSNETVVKLLKLVDGLNKDNQQLQVRGEDETDRQENIIKKIEEKYLQTLKQNEALKEQLRKLVETTSDHFKAQKLKVENLKVQYDLLVEKLRIEVLSIKREFGEYVFDTFIQECVDKIGRLNGIIKFLSETTVPKRTYTIQVVSMWESTLKVLSDMRCQFMERLSIQQQSSNTFPDIAMPQIPPKPPCPLDKFIDSLLEVQSRQAGFFTNQSVDYNSDRPGNNDSNNQGTYPSSMQQINSSTVTLYGTNSAESTSCGMSENSNAVSHQNSIESMNSIKPKETEAETLAKTQAANYYEGNTSKLQADVGSVSTQGTGFCDSKTTDETAKYSRSPEVKTNVRMNVADRLKISRDQSIRASSVHTPEGKPSSFMNGELKDKPVPSSAPTSKESCSDLQYAALFSYNPQHKVEDLPSLVDDVHDEETKALEASKAKKLSGIQKLVAQIAKRFPTVTEKDLKSYVKLARERNNNSLSGLSMDKITDMVQNVMIQLGKA